MSLSLNLFVRVARLLLNPSSQRLYLGLPLAVGLTIAACGGDPDVPQNPSLGTGGSAANGNGEGGAAADSNGGRAGGISIEPPPECVPKTCDELDSNCGKVADGCGDVLDCGECEDGGVCGLVSANVCSTQEDLEDLCKPISKDEACADKDCGVEGDGCGGTYECGTCDDGEGCGVESPFQCSAIVMGSDDDCPAKIEDCASVGAQCGLIGNGCGGTIDCTAETGGCPDGEACGLGGPQLCGAAPTCEPLEPAVACAGKCGVVSNGCDVDVDGGIIDCSALFPCPSGQTCGGAGVPNQCGAANTACKPVTQDVACGDRECGRAGDGCVGSFACGSCASGEVCVSGTCETPACTPTLKATACQGKTCGTVGDGCGGTHVCGTCATGQQCGLRTAFKCDVSACVPLTQPQACANKECGTAYDGCGTAAANRFNCGACPTGQFCGIKTPFQCDAPTPPTCTPTATSCAALGWECGSAVNNCGTVYNCATEGRSCGPLETCVGGITGPATCQSAGGGTCPLCNAVPDCTGRPQVTRLSGRVITPGRTNTDTPNQVGVPNAIVYIRRTNDLVGLPAIPSGIAASGESCDRCGDLDLGPVLASTTTDASGNYTLQGNIPVGQQFVLVVKVGKFRRAVQYTVPATAACTTVNLPTAAATNPTRLPRTMTDGLAGAVNIPRIAVTTGRIDAMECVFHKMGVATSEFANGSATTTGARVHLYRGGTSGSPSGARIDGSTPHDSTLYNDLARMKTYDMVVSDCEGQSWDSGFNQAGRGNIVDYVNRGGRLFASHLSFSWLNDNGTQAYTAANRFTTGLAPAATWDSDAVVDPDLGTGIISRGRPRASSRIENFAAWMVREGIVTAPAYSFNITDPRSQAITLGTSSEEFVHCEGGDCTGGTAGSARTQQFSFNTPYAAPAAAACGRVAYSGFHVVAAGSDPYANADFPDHCAGNLSGQEKVLLYMLFDLGACVGNPPQPPACTKLTCAQAGGCGQRPDGCGGTQTCGCPSGQTCSNNQCVPPPSCVPTTCAAQKVVCSTIDNGCGQALTCPCTVCTPTLKATACQGKCGKVSDGCSNVHTCAACPPACVPLTQCPANSDCGLISDGCNGTLNCGSCTTGKVCGGAGTPNHCDIPMCPKLTCEEVGATCGKIGDGCGGSVDCGTCTPGQLCKTTSGVQSCEGCQPRKCADVEAECGLIGDGCGDTVDCGPCPTGTVCGAIEPNKCGGGSCTPLTCEAAEAECGLIGDGCGDSLDCGTCPPGEVCGIETPFKCDPPPPCEPKTCESAGADCGFVSDGCAELLDCGKCPTGFTCGLVEANSCARVR